MVRQDEVRDVEHFSRWADTYEHSRIQRYIDRIHDAMLEAVASERGAPESVLDVGCGTGRLLRNVRRRWPSARLVGVDPADGMIAVARRLAPNVDFRVAPAESLPVADASIDLAFSAVSFHHWTDQLRGLREVARTLRPGGRLCLADIRMPGWVSKLLRSKAQSAHRMRRLIDQAGLELQAQRMIYARVILVTTALKRATAA